MNDSAARTFRNSLGEFRFVSVCWFCAFLWTLSFCYLRGYQHPADSWLVQIGLAEPRTSGNFRLVLGMPDWIVWGIMLPWIICSVITVLYGLYGMKDDDLGIEAEGETHD
jgi:hypothetical protein